MFLILFRNILCPQQMFPSLRSPRNIMGNNVSTTVVSSFTRAFKQMSKTTGILLTTRSPNNQNRQADLKQTDSINYWQLLEPANDGWQKKIMVSYLDLLLLLTNFTQEFYSQYHYGLTDQSV